MNDENDDFLSQVRDAIVDKSIEGVVGVVINAVISGLGKIGTTPVGNIENIWIDFSEEDARIHLKFRVDNLKDISCLVAIYFYFQDGTVLEDANNSYCSAAGQVAVSIDFVPPYESTNYDDFILSIPCDELHLPPGKHDLKFHVDLYEQVTQKCFARSDAHSFQVDIYTEEAYSGETPKTPTLILIGFICSGIIISGVISFFVWLN
jgi:hypothetical protein